EAGVGSTVEAASMARTWKVCEPSASPVYCCVEDVSQATKLPASSLHWKLTPPSGELKVKLAVVLLVGSVGFVPIAVSGAAVSTVHVYEAGLGSGLLAGLIARSS